MTSAPLAGNYRPREIAMAVTFALLVQAGAAVALQASRLDRSAAVPDIDRDLAIPVKIVPILDPDAPLLKLGGKRNSAKLPDRWLKPKVVERVEEKAFVSTKAEKTVDKIPSKDVPIADAGTDAPPPDAELTKQVDVPIIDVPDAAVESNVDTPGAVDGVKEGTETDPLKARAIDLYRARIAAWFSSRFRVGGSGLPQEELTKFRVTATVQISGDRMVTGYSLSSSGNSAFDAAARSTLEATKGAQIPPPPENYPDTVQSQISLTFVCKENRCD
jgi:hypothetical protein